MSRRWELLELIGQRLEERNLMASEETAEDVLDAIEDLIRVDEREKVNVSWQNDFDNELNDLCAKVHARYQAAAEMAVTKSPEAAQWWWARHEALGEVLALLDGEVLGIPRL